MDCYSLKFFGPFAFALYWVLHGAEVNRKDCLTNGLDTLTANPGHPLGTFCEAFMVFRGMDMDLNLLHKWTENIGLRLYQTEKEV